MTFTQTLSRTLQKTTDKVSSGQAPETHPFFGRRCGRRILIRYRGIAPGASTAEISLFGVRPKSNVFRHRLHSLPYSAHRQSRATPTCPTILSPVIKLTATALNPALINGPAPPP